MTENKQTAQKVKFGVSRLFQNIIDHKTHKTECYNI